MDSSTLIFPLTGVVPAVCDAEASGESHGKLTVSKADPTTGFGASTDSPFGQVAVDQADCLHANRAPGTHGFSAHNIRSLMAELCHALRSSLDNERSTAEDSLRRAGEILRAMGASEPTAATEVRGGLCPWQIRKVINHIEVHLDQPIRNEDLAALVQLNPSHFGRAFRNSFGEPPHGYVIRRRVERAQGLMLSTDAPLSEIALDCGLADQSHLTRLFRRIVGESPKAWRRARIGGPGECV